jgi:hypothetical protein
MSDEAATPQDIADAAYLDALTRYNDIVARYIKYQPYLIANYPDIHNASIEILQRMDEMLDKWEVFADMAIVPDGYPEQMEDYVKLLLDLLLTLEGMDIGTEV